MFGHVPGGKASQLAFQSFFNALRDQICGWFLLGTVKGTSRISDDRNGIFDVVPVFPMLKLVVRLIPTLDVLRLSAETRQEFLKVTSCVGLCGGARRGAR